MVSERPHLINIEGYGYEGGASLVAHGGQADFRPGLLCFPNTTLPGILGPLLTLSSQLGSWLATYHYHPSAVFRFSTLAFHLKAPRTPTH